MSQSGAGRTGPGVPATAIPKPRSIGSQAKAVNCGSGWTYRSGVLACRRTCAKWIAALRVIAFSSNQEREASYLRLMEAAEYVRSSRDGDQFHYVWAARRSLHLLDPSSSLAMLVVEGTSDDDTDSISGEEVIDLAEYYGSAELATADRIIYRQFKHSTVQSDTEWTKSWMKKP